MTVEAEPDPTARLYEELQDRLRAHDKDAAIQAYYDLLASGRTLGEIIGKGRPEQIGKGDREAPNPIQVPLVEQAASPASGAEVSEEAMRSLRQRLEPSPFWRPVLIGSLIAIVGLVASITLVNDTRLHEQTAAAIKQARQAVLSFGRSLGPAPAEHAPTAAGQKAPARAAAPPPVPAPPPPAPVAAPVRPPAAAPAARPAPGPVALPKAAAPPTPAIAPAPPAAVTVKPAAAPPMKAAVAPKVATAATPAPAKPIPPTPAPAKPHPSEAEIAALMTRGDALLVAGDLTSARLFYRRGADLGDGTAALRLGESFDPAFLARAGLGRLAADPKAALYWYRRASELGNPDAALLLQSTEPPRR